MKNESLTASIPQHDYALALKSAVSWLGDRYLLAEPLPKRHEEHTNYIRRLGNEPATSISSLS